jgi:hypothetical protein
MYLLKSGLAGAVLALAAVPAHAQIDNRDPAGSSRASRRPASAR